MILCRYFFTSIPPNFTLTKKNLGIVIMFKSSSRDLRMANVYQSLPVYWTAWYPGVDQSSALPPGPSETSPAPSPVGTFLAARAWQSHSNQHSPFPACALRSCRNNFKLQCIELQSSLVHHPFRLLEEESEEKFMKICHSKTKCEHKQNTIQYLFEIFKLFLLTIYYKTFSVVFTLN